MTPYRSLDRSEASLGPIVRAHVRKPRVGPAPLVLCSIAALLCIAGASSHPTLIGAAAIASLGVVVSLALYLVDVKRLRANAGVSVHDRGLQLHGARPRIVPWNEITAIELRRFTRSKPTSAVFMPLPGIIVYGNVTEVHWALRVRAGNEVIAEITDEYEQSTELGNAVRAAIAEREVPRVLESEEGTFGPLRVTREHLELHGERIAWTDIATIELREQYLRVVDRVAALRGRVPIERVPNVHVFLAVAEAMIERRAIALA